MEDWSSNSKQNVTCVTLEQYTEISVVQSRFEQFWNLMKERKNELKIKLEVTKKLEAENQQKVEVYITESKDE